MLNARQAEDLKKLIHSHTGILIPGTKQYLLEARISKALRKLGLNDAERLVQGLKQGDPAMWSALVGSITTGHTYFMRENEHFDRLLQDIRGRPESEIRIWVAACATGEEVYSIAITLLDAGIRHFRILASDINREDLVQLKQGTYQAGRFRTVPPGWRERWFRESGTDRTGEPVLRAVPELRAHVLARQLNLLDMLRFDQAFEYIFCRNVFMYFDRPTQRRVLGMLLHNLRPDGILFMGQSENLFGLSDGLVSPSPGEYWRK